MVEHPVVPSGAQRLRQQRRRALVDGRRAHLHGRGESCLAADDHEPARWHFRLDGTDYLAESNGAQWSVTVSPPSAPADVTITATTQSLAALIFTGSDAGIDITGETEAANDSGS